jgi:hypothetical protein
MPALPLLVAATVAVWIPARTSLSPWHLLLLLGLALAGRAVPAWIGPLGSYLFELGTILLLVRADVDTFLVLAAVTAVTLQRHLVNSDALTGGTDRGWGLDPLGWELRSIGWLAGAVATSAIALVTLGYTALVAVVRLVTAQVDRYRADQTNSLRDGGG